jgi:hypothetical protein
MKLFRSEPLTEPEKRYLRRSKGIVLPHSAAVGPKPLDRPKDRDFLAPRKPDYVPCKPRGRSGCRMSHEKRALVLQRAFDREKFFASL